MSHPSHPVIGVGNQMCPHIFDLCKDCDVVACMSCKKEWTASTKVWDIPFASPYWDTSGGTYTVTTSSTCACSGCAASYDCDNC